MRLHAAASCLVLLAACATQPAQEWPADVVSFDRMVLAGPVGLTISRKFGQDLPRGVVGLKLWVDEQGRVRKVVQLESSGHENLDAAAAQSALGLRFKPWLRDGQPAPVTVLMPYRMI